MTTSLWCLVAVTFFPIILAPVGVYFRQQSFGSVDNKNPRTQSAALEGAGARAVAAQGNAWEALAMFTVAVVAVHFAGVGAGSAAATASLAFVAARVVHPILYIADKDMLRSLSWVIGVACCIRLIYLAAVGPA
jgi:uncharacterized MAPEG superfamily protein